MNKKNDIAGDLLIGAHMSVAGGLYTAFQRADRVGCTALQIFTKNSNQWNDPALTAEDIAKYRDAENKSKVRLVVSHDSYLINLCGATQELLLRSRKAFINEIERCRLLGIRYVIFHPGAHTTQDRKSALKLVSKSLNYAHDATVEAAKPDFSDAKISFEADVNSISTKNDQRDGHLKSADFFDAANHPKITFVSSSVANKSGGALEILGNLTFGQISWAVQDSNL